MNCKERDRDGDGWEKMQAYMDSYLHVISCDVEIIITLPPPSHTVAPLQDDSYID